MGYTVIAMETKNRALIARVHFEAPGRPAREQQVSWPATVSRREVEITLEDLHRQFLAESASDAPAPIHEAMALVGERHEPGAPAKEDI